MKVLKMREEPWSANLADAGPDTMIGGKFERLATDLMIFTETKLPGAYVIEVQKIEDQHGFFLKSLVREII